MKRKLNSHFSKKNKISISNYFSRILSDINNEYDFLIDRLAMKTAKLLDRTRLSI